MPRQRGGALLHSEEFMTGSDLNPLLNWQGGRLTSLTLWLPLRSPSDFVLIGRT